jgi:HEAT repeat protein
MARTAIPTLLAQLRSRNDEVADRAATALWSRAESAPEELRSTETISALMQLATHRSYTARNCAVNVLDAAAPQEAVRRICAGLVHPDRKRREAAAKRLSQVLNSGAESLTAELKRSGRPALLKAVVDDRMLVRGEAMRALGTLQIEEGIPAMVEALESEDSFAQGDAALALGKLGKRAAVAIPKLVKLLDTGNGHFAAQALGAMGSEGAAAIPHLEKARAAAKEQGDDELDEACGEALKRLKRSAKKG